MRLLAERRTSLHPASIRAEEQKVLLPRRVTEANIRGEGAATRYPSVPTLPLPSPFPLQSHRRLVPHLLWRAFGTTGTELCGNPSSEFPGVRLP